MATSTTTDIPVAASTFGPWTKAHVVQADRTSIHVKFTGTKNEPMVVNAAIDYGNGWVKPCGYFNLYEDGQIMTVIFPMPKGAELHLRATTDGDVEWITAEVEEKP